MTGPGDHDEPYEFGRHPTHADFSPFTILTYSRLLVYRSKVRAGLRGFGDLIPEPGPPDLPQPVPVPPADEPQPYEYDG